MFRLFQNLLGLFIFGILFLSPHVNAEMVKFGLRHGAAVVLVPVHEKAGVFTLYVESHSQSLETADLVCRESLSGDVLYPISGEFSVLAAPVYLISEGSFTGLTANTIPIHVQPSSESIPLLVDKKGVTTLLVFNLETRQVRVGTEPSGNGDSWLDLLVSVPWTDRHAAKFSGLR